MAEPCDTPCVPWDEQQGYDSDYDGDVACSNCGVALREHQALRNKEADRG